MFKMNCLAAWIDLGHELASPWIAPTVHYTPQSQPYGFDSFSSRNGHPFVTSWHFSLRERVHPRHFVTLPLSEGITYQGNNLSGALWEVAPSGIVPLSLWLRQSQLPFQGSSKKWRLRRIWPLRQNLSVLPPLLTKERLKQKRLRCIVIPNSEFRIPHFQCLDKRGLFLVQ